MSRHRLDSSGAFRVEGCRLAPRSGGCRRRLERRRGQVDPCSSYPSAVRFATPMNDRTRKTDVDLWGFEVPVRSEIRHALTPVVPAHCPRRVALPTRSRPRARGRLRGLVRRSRPGAVPRSDAPRCCGSSCPSGLARSGSGSRRSGRPLPARRSMASMLRRFGRAVDVAGPKGLFLGVDSVLDEPALGADDPPAGPVDVGRCGSIRPERARRRTRA